MTKTLADRFSATAALPFPPQAPDERGRPRCRGTVFRRRRGEHVHIRDAVKCRRPSIRPAADVPLVSHSSSRPPPARLAGKMVLQHSKDSQSINQSLLCLQGRALRIGVGWLPGVRKQSVPSVYSKQAHHQFRHLISEQKQAASKTRIRVHSHIDCYTTRAARGKCPNSRCSATALYRVV